MSHHDLDSAWAYYELHRADIDQQIASNESLAYEPTSVASSSSIFLVPRGNQT